MIGQKRRKSFVSAANAAAGLIDPILRKKAGLNMRLIENWAEIAGRDIAASVMPLKIVWPRQSSAELRAGGLAAGLLVLACFGYAALQAQHKTAEIQARINRFFGYPAIGKIRIEQKMPRSRPLGAGKEGKAGKGENGENAAQGGLLGGFAASAFAAGKNEESLAEAAEFKAQAALVQDEALRAALTRLARSLHK